MTEVQKIKKAMKKLEGKYEKAGPVTRQRLQRKAEQLVSRLAYLKS